MTMFKRFAALMAVVMVLAMTMAAPVAAAGFTANGTSGCSSTNTAEECQVAKAIGNGVEYAIAKGTEGYAYDVQVKAPDGTDAVIWLKSRPEVDNFSVGMTNDGQLNVQGIGTGDANQWNNLFGRYRTVVVGVSGVGAITMIVFFIINFMKLGSSAGNPQARSQALTGVLWTGLAAAGLGAVSIIAGFFYNAL